MPDIHIFPRGSHQRDFSTIKRVMQPTPSSRERARDGFPQDVDSTRLWTEEKFAIAKIDRILI
jgi:hypothetical protein